MSNRIKYHFLYKTTNLINGKYYYGMHSTYKLNDGYLGSGKILRYSILKYGKENFSIKIIEFLSSREDLINAEINLITEEMLIDNNLCMNLKKGGMGGIISNEHQIKMKEGASKWMNSLWKDEEWVKKFKSGVSNRNKEQYENGVRQKVYFYDWTGKNLSDETKRKIGEKNSLNQKGEKNSQFGTCWITREGLNKKIKKEDLEIYLSEGWVKGRK
jgi:hypothetical protein